MKRLTLISVAMTAAMMWSFTDAVPAKAIVPSPLLAGILNGLNKWTKVRSYRGDAENPQEWRFRRLTGDTLVLRLGRKVSHIHTGDIDSLWVREGSKSGAVGFLVGGGVAGTYEF